MSTDNKNIPLLLRPVYALIGLALRLMALLPFSLLYMLSSCMAFLAYRVVKYRRALVYRNIADSFPELDEDGRRRAVSRFYRHLADYFVETVKFAHMSESSIRRHMEFVNTELIDNTIAQGRDIVIYTSHFGNWEWITSMGLWCGSASSAHFSHVYRPLKNKWFDCWFLRLRTRFNVSIPKNDVFRRLLTWRRDNVRWVTGFLSDQKPSHGGKVYNVPFLNRETPFIAGTEELACKLNAVVMYFDTRVMARGHYRSTIRLISDNPRAEYPGNITRRYAATLEEQIRRCPEAYLWSHNRWRLSRDEYTHK